jgi:RNA polymerase sigma-70 factor, ECF subfamily
VAVDPQAAPLQGPSADITRMLKAAGEGDASASAALFTHVYNELRSIADHQMRDERRSHTLGATALVHEVYLRLLGGEPLRVRDRAGFFHAAAEAMRRILIEHARQRGRAKRGGQRRRIPLDVVDLASEEQFGEFLAVDEALQRLEREDAQAAEVVRLRFFAGLSVEEVAAVLGASPRTVARDWAFARAWLFRALGDASD